MKPSALNMQSSHMTQLVQGLFTADPEARYTAVQIVLGILVLQSFIQCHLSQTREHVDDRFSPPSKVCNEPQQTARGAVPMAREIVTHLVSLCQRFDEAQLLPLSSRNDNFFASVIEIDG